MLSPLLHLIDARLATLLCLAGALCGIVATVLLARSLILARCSVFAWDRLPTSGGPARSGLHGLGRLWRDRAALTRTALGAGAIGALCFAIAPYAVYDLHADARRDALRALRSIVAAQEASRSACDVDQDWDGQGEYAWLGELAAVQPLRGNRWGRRGAARIAERLGARTAAGIARSRGYCFAMYLPDPEGRWQPEPVVADGTVALAAPSAPEAADGQERAWICYAWPTSVPRWGPVCYAADQTGRIVAATARYEGSDRVPSPEAALAADDDALARSDQLGRDGNRWSSVWP